MKRRWRAALPAAAAIAVRRWRWRRGGRVGDVDGVSVMESLTRSAVNEGRIDMWVGDCEFENRVC